MRTYFTRRAHDSVLRAMLPALLVGGALLISGGLCQAGMVFSDGFEGPGLDPFWTLDVMNGTVTVPSPAAAHTGANSARFDSTAGTRNIFIRHDFATPVYGTVSVWAYDTGADLGSSNFLNMGLFNLGAGQNTNLGTWDYDHGSPDQSSYHNYQQWGAGGPTASSIDRTQAWHQWEITSNPTLFEMRVDGSLVYSDVSGLPFDVIRIGMFAPAFRPNWVGYFDDFSFVEYDVNAVPEPTSMALLGFASLGGLGLRWRQRRKAQASQAAA